MSKKLFVAGLAWETTEETIREAFAPFGPIEAVVLVRDRDTGRSRGFGFVSYVTPAAASRAQEQMDGVALDGRSLKVDVAWERSARVGERDGHEGHHAANGRGDRAPRGFRREELGGRGRSRRWSERDRGRRNAYAEDDDEGW
jgi:RNA recognition motif-containing protein